MKNCGSPLARDKVHRPPASQDLPPCPTRRETDVGAAAQSDPSTTSANDVAMGGRRLFQGQAVQALLLG
eukprot:6177251-Pleurochrysis_carterae.AAC.1